MSLKLKNDPNSLTLTHLESQILYWEKVKQQAQSYIDGIRAAIRHIQFLDDQIGELESELQECKENGE